MVGMKVAAIEFNPLGFGDFPATTVTYLVGRLYSHSHNQDSGYCQGKLTNDTISKDGSARCHTITIGSHRVFFNVLQLVEWWVSEAMP